MAIITPSAKSHERVTGRWVRDFEFQTPRDWIVYYAKVIFGTPIPYLMWSYVIVTFMSRAGSEIAAWGCAILTLIYIAADRFASSREIKLFSIGGDFFLLGYVIVCASSAFTADTPLDSLASLSGARWVLLLYLMTYCWELFPGLNRVFALLFFASCSACLYGIWQHFTGVDLIRNAELPSAPVPSSIFFVSQGFFSTPEIFGTLIAMAAPYPLAAYLCAHRKDPQFKRYAFLGLGLLLLLGVFWTYRPGLWAAALGSVLVATFMQPRRLFGVLLAVTVFFSAVILVSYESTNAFIESVQLSEESRSERQREQINSQVELWQTSPWLGVGNKAQSMTNYDPGTGNIYFHLLAQTGFLGLGFYLLFILGLLLGTYRIFNEIPASHYWHRVIVVGTLASQIAFHISGLFWSTLSEAIAVNLFVLIVSATCYIIEHYSRGLVTDDESL